MKNNSIKNKIKQLNQEYERIKSEIDKSKKISFNKENEKNIILKISIIKNLKKETYNNNTIKELNRLEKKYRNLIKVPSRIICKHYNYLNGTDYKIEDVIKVSKEFYYKNGIYKSIVSKYIPHLIAEEINMVLPSDPKDEYPLARKMKRKFILHLGDTNTGKTFNAIKRLKEANRGIYLSPLRILALENFDRLNKDGIFCNLETGEEEIIIPFATHTSCTVEKLNINNKYDIAVIDEIQLINDIQRGFAWTRALLGLQCEEIHLCGALNSKDLLIKLIESCNDTYEIYEYKRNTPLIVEDSVFNYSNIREGDALVVFSKKKVLQLASFLKERFGINASVIYGNLPPEVRKRQYESFLNKETTILITTDAIGLGVNLPIGRIVLIETNKYDGESRRVLTTQEIKQICGRAGRKGMYDKGYVSCYDKFSIDYIKNSITDKDIPIDYAILGPSENLLNLKRLSLIEKLSIWNESILENKSYRKLDISHHLLILNSIIKYNLDEKSQWNLTKIPFDEKEDILFKQFIDYVEEYFLNNKTELFFPKRIGNSLGELEIYYQMISLYYSFSKAFNLNIDNRKIIEERKNVTEEINILLKEDVITFKKVCKCCGKGLSIDFKYNLCNKCFYEKRYKITRG